MTHNVGLRSCGQQINLLCRGMAEEEELALASKTTRVGLNGRKNDHDSSGKARRNPDRKRHGARNQHKMKDFVRWLLSTFALPEGSLVVDVAGGNGELAARLCVCHKLHVVMVDPRPADLIRCFETTVLTKLPKKWQERTNARLAEDANFVANIFKERFTQLVMPLDTPLRSDTEESLALQKAFESCALLVGMHADGATEAVVEVAMQYKKPFVVVPCCVFPNLFQDRHVEEEDGRRTQVRSHEQFCRYLAARDPRFRTEILPFQGRNVAIWWDGKHNDDEIDAKPEKLSA